MDAAGRRYSMLSQQVDDFHLKIKIESYMNNVGNAPVNAYVGNQLIFSIREPEFERTTQRRFANFSRT